MSAIWTSSGMPPPVCSDLYRFLTTCTTPPTGLPALPAGQNPLPCTGTVTHAPFRPHTRGPGIPSFSIIRFHPPVHYRLQNFSLALSHSYCRHHNSRLRECFVFQGVGEYIWRPGSHHIKPWRPVHLLPVGRLVQPA